MAEPKHVAEAALFSAGKPLSIGEIAKATGMDEAAVRGAIRSLLKVYRVRETALEIAKIGPRYSLQLKAEYIQPTQVVARKELPLPMLKIAALVGYYQPMHKKDLVEMVGPRGWEHVLGLEKLGLLLVRRSGHGYAIQTSPKYAEYFGLAAKTREDIKRILAKKAGINVPEKPKVESQPAEAQQQAAEGQAEAEKPGETPVEGAEAPAEAQKEVTIEKEPAANDDAGSGKNEGD